MESPINAILRKPFYGVIPANGMLALPVSPPMTAQETLLCAASRPGEVTFTTPRPDAIVVTSRAPMPVLFGALIVPTNVIGPTDSTWNRLAARLGAWIAKLRA